MSDEMFFYYFFLGIVGGLGYWGWRVCACVFTCEADLNGYGNLVDWFYGLTGNVDESVFVKNEVPLRFWMIFLYQSRRSCRNV